MHLLQHNKQHTHDTDALKSCISETVGECMVTVTCCGGSIMIKLSEPD